MLLGLDGAGKTSLFYFICAVNAGCTRTSLLYKLKLGSDVEPRPTACYNVETIKYKRVDFTIFDISGHKDVRVVWPCYLPDCDAIIFVVDASDRLRIDEAARELKKILTHEDTTIAKPLVLANKQDKPYSMAIDELHERLDIASAIRVACRVEKSAVAKGVGVYEGLDWIIEEISAVQDDFHYVGLPGTGGGSLLAWVPRSSEGGHFELTAQLNVS